MRKKFTMLVSALAVITAACFAGCGNELTLVEATKPTCTENGQSQYYTDSNGKYYKDADGKEEISAESVLISALGHSYGAPVFSWNNDYSEASATFICSRDGSHTHTETAVITSAVTEATCADGKTVYTATVTFEGEDYTDKKEQVIPAVQEHSGLTEYESDATNHWYECSVCHTNVGLEKHNFVWITDKEASETETGLRHEECTVCEYKRNENTEIPSTSGLIHYPAKDSTCTEHGNIEYWEIDGKYYSDEAHTNEITLKSTEKPLKPHTPESGWQNGEDKHWHNCSVCGNPADEKQDHSFEWVTDREATETETGLKHEECTVCEVKRNENTEIPSMGTLVHHPEQASTCTVQGNIEYWEIGGKYYSDEAHTNEITLQSTKKPLAAHTPESGWQKGDGKHWHNCSVCGNPAGEKQDHSYTEEVTAPTCTEQGHTTHTCECGESYTDGEIPALGHKYFSFYDSDEGKFYRVCENDATDKTEVGVYEDRTVTVNGNEYNPYTCYSTENSSVTYDAIEQLFVIHIDGNFADGLTIVGSNNEVVVSVDADTTIAFLTFENGFRKLYIRGTHELTITGDLSSQANPTTIECDTVVNGELKTNSQPVIILSGNVTLNNGINETANNIIVGSADNSTSPVLTIKANSSQAAINSSGFNALNIQLLSGTTSLIQQDAGNNCGISCHRADDVITVGEHATFNITGFSIGVAGWDGAANAANFNIYGTVNISGCGSNQNPAIQNMVVNVGSEQYAGKLYITTSSWGISGSKLNFINGKALIARDTDEGSEFAAFNGVSELKVEAGFKLGIRSLSVSIFGGEPAGTVDPDAVIAVYNMRSPDNIVTNNYGDDLTAFLTAMGEN